MNGKHGSRGATPFAPSCLRRPPTSTASFSWARGWVCGAMTTAGGLGHTMPFLIPNIHIATAVAIAVVCVELGVIAWIRHKYMDSPWTTATTGRG